MFKAYAGSMPVREFLTFHDAEAYIMRCRKNYYLLCLYILTPSGAKITF